MKFPTALILTLLTTVAHAGLPPSQAPRMMSVQTQNGDVSVAPMDVIQDGGFGMVRKGVYWSAVEPRRGVYDFTSSDAIVNLARARNMYVSITLYGNNSLYETFTAPGITTAAGRKGFAAFAAAIAARYKNAPVVYEIWNEPNLRSFWGGSSNTNAIAAQYVNLVKEVAPAMRKADPNAYISAGSVSTLWNGKPGSFQWFDECVRLGLIDTPISAISQHPYGSSYPELMIPLYAQLRAKIDAAGGRALHITNTEVGYHQGWIVSRQGFTAKEAEDVQGWMIIRQNLVDLMSGLKYSNWYEFRHSDQKWSVVSPSLAPFPVYEAAKIYSEQLAGYSFVRRLTQTNANNYVAIFRNSSGRQKAVVWTGTPRTTATVRISGVSGTGTVRSVNAFGAARTYPIASGAISAALSNQPQYIDIGIPSAGVTPTPTPSPAPQPTATPSPTPVPASNLRNLAIGKVPVVTSGADQASRLTDGVSTGTTSSANRWNSSSSYPQSITVSFAKAREVSQVKYFQQYQRTSDFRIEVYAGGKWTAVAGRSGNTSLNIQTSFKAVNANAVRLTILKGTLYQRAYEIQVMGK